MIHKNKTYEIKPHKSLTKLVHKSETHKNDPQNESYKNDSQKCL